MKQNCICNLNNEKREKFTLFQCQNCEKEFHRGCYQLQVGSGLCIGCRFKNMEASVKLEQQLQQYQIQMVNHEKNSISIKFQMNKDKIIEMKNNYIVLIFTEVKNHSDSKLELQFPNENANSMMIGKTVQQFYTLKLNKYQIQSNKLINRNGYFLIRMDGQIYENLREINEFKIQLTHHKDASKIVSKKCVSGIFSGVPRSQNEILSVIQSNQGKVSQKNDIQITQQDISLIDPNSKSSIQIPVRGKNCSHLQCFDLQYFIEMSQQDSVCPICKQFIIWQQLYIDKKFQELIEKAKEKNFDINQKFKMSEQGDIIYTQNTIKQPIEIEIIDENKKYETRVKLENDEHEQKIEELPPNSNKNIVISCLNFEDQVKSSLDQQVLQDHKSQESDMKLIKKAQNEHQEFEFEFDLSVDSYYNDKNQIEQDKIQQDVININEIEDTIQKKVKYNEDITVQKETLKKDKAQIAQNSKTQNHSVQNKQQEIIMIEEEITIIKDQQETTKIHQMPQNQQSDNENRKNRLIEELQSNNQQIINQKILQSDCFILKQSETPILTKKKNDNEEKLFEDQYFSDDEMIQEQKQNQKQQRQKQIINLESSSQKEKCHKKSQPTEKNLTKQNINLILGIFKENIPFDVEQFKSSMNNLQANVCNKLGKQDQIQILEELKIANDFSDKISCFNPAYPIKSSLYKTAEKLLQQKTIGQMCIFLYYCYHSRPNLDGKVHKITQMLVDYAKNQQIEISIIYEISLVLTLQIYQNQQDQTYKQTFIQIFGKMLNKIFNQFNFDQEMIIKSLSLITRFKELQFPTQSEYYLKQINDFTSFYVQVLNEQPSFFQILQQLFSFRGLESEQDQIFANRFIYFLQIFKQQSSKQNFKKPNSNQNVPDELLIENLLKFSHIFQPLLKNNNYKQIVKINNKQMGLC